MKQHRFASCLVLCLSTACSRPEVAQLRVMSYNIHHGIGMDRRLDLDRTAQAIHQATPDLVALQEVDRRTHRSNGVDQLTVLSQATGLQPIFGKTIDFDGGEYGIGILSRLPVEYHQIHPLPKTPSHEKRVLMEVGVRVAGRKLIFYNTDLDDNKDDAERSGSIDVFEESLREHERVPVILAGDLFLTSDQAILQRLLATLRDPLEYGHDPDSFTAPADRPVRRIDYVLYRSDPQFRCIDYEVIPDAVTAQHRPVLAVFSIRAEPQISSASPKTNRIIHCP